MQAASPDVKKTWLLTATYADPGMARIAQWIADMMPACSPTAAKLGPTRTPCILVAQAGLETGWGRFCIDHNLFNIEADASWHGPTMTVPTQEFLSGRYQTLDLPFRVYDTYEASIADHFQFLFENTRYADAGVFTAVTDEDFARALKRGGYATDPNYAESLIATLQTVRNFVASMRVVDSDEPAAPIPSPPHADAGAGSFHILMVGAGGNDVKALQVKLGFTGGDVDGKFGAQTFSAVRSFQAAHALQVDGVVGRLTAGALGLVT